MATAAKKKKQTKVKVQRGGTRKPKQKSKVVVMPRQDRREDREVATTVAPTPKPPKPASTPVSTPSPAASDGPKTAKEFKDSFIPSFEEFPAMAGTDFLDLVMRRHEWKQKEDEAAAERKKLDEEIEALMIVSEQDKVMAGPIKVVRQNGGTGSKIDGKKLVECGVGADVVEACTIPGTKFTFVRTIME